MERVAWTGLLNAFQIQDNFHHERGPTFSWSNGKKCASRRLARLDRFYTPNQRRLGFHHKTYYIHGYTVGSDHSPIQLEISIGNSEVKASAFKWNVSHLQGDIGDLLSDK